MTDNDNSENSGHGRNYIVLMHLPEGGFREITTVLADNPTQAGRYAAKQVDDTLLEQGVELVMVPERNWTEIKIRLQKQDRLVTG